MSDMALLCTATGLSTRLALRQRLPLGDSLFAAMAPL